MKPTPEEIQSYRLEITNSSLSQEAKDRALQILNSPDLTSDSFDQITDIIQNDIDADLATLDGLNEAVAEDPEYQAIVADTERQMKEIQDDLQESMNAVEVEVSQLDSLAEQLDQASSDTRLAELKQKLGQG